MKAKKGAVAKKGGGAKAGMKRSMKAKVVSKIAKGSRAKSAVFAGRKERSAMSKKQWAAGKLKKWADAVKKARKALGVTGFCAIGGSSAKGKALYAKAKSFLD